MPFILQENINLFRSLFRGRTDVYARFWINFSTKQSGFAPVYRLNNQREILDINIIKLHFLGKEAIGIYPLLSDNTTFFLAIDFDKGNWLNEANKLINAAKFYQLPCYLERSKSGNGGHVWFFFSNNIPCFKARNLGKYLLQKANIQRKTFDRMFPNQDEHTGKGLGNLIFLPLQGKYLLEDNTAFINENGEIYADQWQYLRSFQKISMEQIDKILNTMIIAFPQKDKKSALAKQKIKTDLNEQEIEENDEKIQIKTTQTPETKLILANQIFIPETFLPDKLYKYLKSVLNFPNPEYFENERYGYSNWHTPRFIKTLERVAGGVLIPAGFLENIKEFSQNNNLKLVIQNQQIVKKPISFSSILKLKPEQLKVAKKLLKQDRIILEAKPGFGKTIVALYCIKRLKQPALVIVHTRSLLHQWKKKIEELFKFKKHYLEIIGDCKWEVGKKITVASYQTLAKRGVEEIKNLFGMVVVDECHHVPAKTLTYVVKNLPAKYVLGLTATAFRKDKLEKLMKFYVGPILKTEDNNITNLIASKSLENEGTKVTTKVITKRTDFKLEKGTINDFQETIRQLINNAERNQLIINDLVSALTIGAKCLVLTERVEHCEILLKELRKQIKGIQAAVVTGKITKKKRLSMVKRLKQDRLQLLIATGKLIGEGFDWPELTHLFLAFPFSWKGKLIQYVGRVQREADNKNEAYIYDYLDYDVPMLRIMYFRRLRTYRSLNLRKEKVVLNRNNKIPENQLGLF